MTLPLLPHQIEGADFLAARPRAGLFDIMGYGKTAQAIGAMDRAGARRALIICPAAVRQVWAGEFEKFAAVKRKILKGKDIADLNLWRRGRVDVLILSYEMATKWAKHLEGDLIDVIVFDEAHYLKGWSTQRTRAMLSTHCDGIHGLARWGAQVWFLTATPAPNDPCDIWPFLRFVGGTNLALRPFTDRYFTTRLTSFSARHTPRKETVAEIVRTIELHSLRRTEGVKLPPIFLTTTTVDGDTTEIREMLRQLPDLEDAIIRAIDKGGLSFLDAQHIATLRRLVAEAKAPAYAQLLLEELNGGSGKIVVFGIHRNAGDRIAERLRTAGVEHVRFDGETSERDRERAVAAFQREGGPRVFLANIRAAGTGLTLTAAARIDMFETDWAPAANAQAIMRVHRIGQEKTVHARLISLARTIDEAVNEIVADKTKAIAQIGLTMGLEAA